jgi:hypothetical protein
MAKKRFGDPRRNTTIVPPVYNTMYDPLYNTDGPRAEDTSVDVPEFIQPRTPRFRNPYVQPDRFLTKIPNVNTSPSIGTDPRLTDDTGRMLPSTKGEGPNYALGAIGAAPGVVGGIVSAIAANNRLKKLKRMDVTPVEVKEGYADATNRAASAKVANYGQQVEDINSGATKATAAINAGATTGSQAVQGAANVQANTNNAFRNLNGQGLTSQNQRIARLDNFRNQMAKYKTLSNDMYNNERSALYNARAKGIEGAVNSAASGALLAGFA